MSNAPDEPTEAERELLNVFRFAKEEFVWAYLRAHVAAEVAKATVPYINAACEAQIAFGLIHSAMLAGRSDEVLLHSGAMEASMSKITGARAQQNDT